MQGPHPFYKPKKDCLMPDMDLPPAAVQAGNVHDQNHKGASQQCDYYFEYADHSSFMGVLVRDVVKCCLTTKTRLTANSV